MKDMDEKDAINHLVEKTGLNPQYIRRRVRVMSLPSDVLDLWKEGKLLYGHMEQFIRLAPEMASEMAIEYAKETYSVSKLRNEIDNAKCYLKDAQFDKKAAGCTKCNRSTQVQKALFGEDFGTDGVRCLNLDCFVKNQSDFMAKSWLNSKYAIEYGTNAAMVKTNDTKYAYIYGISKDKCATCEKLATLYWPGGDLFTRRACLGSDSCYKHEYASSLSSTSPRSPEAKMAERIKGHASEFSSRFLHDRLTVKLAEAPWEDLRTLRITLMGLIKSNDRMLWKMLGVDSNNWNERIAAPKRLFESVLIMEKNEIIDWISKINIAVIMNPFNTSLPERKIIAEQFDIILKRDFTMTEDYLKKKKKVELISLSDQFDKIIDKSPEIIGKMKKTELIAEILKKNLSGLIPDEIMAIAVAPAKTDADDAPNFEPDDEDED
jgi:hypothetical protein